MVKHYSVYVCWECLWMRLTSECRWDSSNPLKPCRHAQLSLFVTLWTVAHQTPLSMRFSRQECWSGLPCPPSRDLPDPGIEHLSCCAGRLFITGETILTCNFFVCGTFVSCWYQGNADLVKCVQKTSPFFCFFKVQKGLVLILFWIFGRIHQ